MSGSWFVAQALSGSRTRTNRIVNEKALQMKGRREAHAADAQVDGRAGTSPVGSQAQRTKMVPMPSFTSRAATEEKPGSGSLAGVRAET